MQLTVWTYEGPPHVGAMRIATGMRGVHYVLHAPQGDTYADLLFTMIERRAERPPVTYTTFQASDLGADTAQLFKTAAAQAYARFRPEVMLVGSSCTAELIQDDPGGLTAALNLPIPVVPLELPSYQKKENWGASETFYQLVRALCGPHAPPPGAPRLPRDAGRRPTCNLLGATALGFRHRDDVAEVTRLLDALGVDVAVAAPLGASAAEVARLGEADFNVVLYPETGLAAAEWLKRTFAQPMVRTVPIGVGATRDFAAEVAAVAGLDADAARAAVDSRLPWYSRSVDSNYLTGKRVFIFGDATHAVAAARIASEELGFRVCGLGTYSREFAREVRAKAAELGIEPTITDDYLEVEAAIAAAAPELVLGTQMERHVAKRLGVPCAVISAPVHVQDFPARYSPQMGPEGANVIFDTWVHPLMMGLEEHLLQMFRGDFEFADGATPSHLGTGGSAKVRECESAKVGDSDSAEAEPPAVPAPPALAITVSAVSIDPATSTDAIAATAPSPSTASTASAASMESSASTESTASSESSASTESTASTASAESTASPPSTTPDVVAWAAEAEKELGKIPFFVRGKARRNTERFAAERGIGVVTVDTLYDAKAHFAR